MRSTQMNSPVASATNRSLAACLAVLLCLAVVDAAHGQPSAASTRWRKQQLLIPAATPKVQMITSVLLPSGRAPYPLAVINHGTTESEELRAAYSEPNFEVASSWLLEHGFAVALPQRPGHGDTAGPYLETAHGCDNARYEDAGHATADSIDAVITHLAREPYVKKQPVLLVGHSAGAWGALALASRRAGIAAVINFSGGRGGRAAGVANRNCAPDRLTGAAASFGSTSRLPTLWLYSQNDSYFGSGLSRRMADAYRSAGGRADYRLLPAIADEGHYLIYSQEAVRHWGPIVEKFLGGVHRAEARPR